MIRAIVRRRTEVLLMALVLSAIFIAAIPFIASGVSQKAINGDGNKELVHLKKDSNNGKSDDSNKDKNDGVKIDTGYRTRTIGPNGGYIHVNKDIYFVVPAGALKDDVKIGVRMKRDKKDRKTKFYFSPEGLEFSIPAAIQAYWKSIDDAEEENPGLQYAVEVDKVIYKVGSEIKPEIEAWGVTWKIDHFSLYYYRRR